MTISIHFIIPRQVFERLTLKNDSIIIRWDIFKSLRSANKIAGIHSITITIRSLLKGEHLVITQIYLQNSEFASGLVGY